MGKVLAITACPVGIAHTYMAAENLQKAGAALGVDIKVETQGSIGVENALTEQDIAEADGIIIAADKEVAKDRFAGKRVIITGVKDGIRKPEELIKRIQSGDVPVYKPESASSNDSKKRTSKENPVYKHLMNGVSYMVPFIVVGGLLIAIALTLGGEQTPGGIKVPDGTIWKQIESLGSTAFMFMVPILAGFIAVSIADRPGLVPGMIGGYIAATGSFYGSDAGAGFIGGIIAGFLAGYVALGIKKIKVPKAVQPVMPIIFIPILSSAIVGLLFIYVIGKPVAGVFEALTSWLAGMQGGSSIVLAMILGAMIAVDMGGPFNKVAFLFGSAMIGEGNYEIMGPIAAAICIPPIGLGVATFISKRKFSQMERETGKASFTMGLFGITEGAIPFAAQDPLRVIPSIVVGSMTGSVIAMMAGVGDKVAHGGPIVAVLGAVDHVAMFFVAVIVGVAVTALLVTVLKKNVEGASIKEETAVSPVREMEAGNSEVASGQDIHQLTDITNLELIETDLSGSTRDDVINELIAKLDGEGILSSKEAYRQAIIKREEESSTGLGMNIAIPHGKTNAVTRPAVAFGIKRDGVDWNSLDGTDAKLVFMIAVPEHAAGDAHLKILQMLSRKLMDDGFRENLIKVTSKEEAFKQLGTIR
ncbi:PTS system D-mannose-specific IIA component, Fru family /PTS system D-mannose-specific IIB component, Fru family /PTS system D-mannose-specific IIC component, Fru family [Fictibacillus enclensis]|uniref:PTS mannose transporter subunit IIABC n=1 Tax=Fictibacillus enclensis TaxID=1017270 RepID=A0A0V8J353_9BACL|nr:PTS fructose transporter subunit IIABC [Fictibacillus enclensis]KSU81136.1 PTS mannose transporter subunit IIABC [Fictibacillus enclensis]SCC35415.1 PTS system D-mannose-specific IIA component, Fru family /PTS system D-mannose-specific IIB component, Fru family /PTS system D-mannose-specific IIC component, Fru family [Fictibacillus enclensis]